MEFRLLYSGPLLSASRSDTRINLKHEIRRQFHPQLERLWATHKGLIELSKHHNTAWHQDPENRPTSEEVEQFRHSTPEEAFERMRRGGLKYFAKKWERCGCGFIPLVTEGVVVRCSIDILFLRPEIPGRVIQGGDLDNRVKTIFDALRIPKNRDECGGDFIPEKENPTYCLLEDDSLISEVRVVTDRLLMLPRTEKISQNDVFLVLHVKIDPLSGNNWEWVYR
jgi:hypothetical protein